MSLVITALFWLYLLSLTHGNRQSSFLFHLLKEIIMSTIKFAKVATLPVTLAPSTLYMVAPAGSSIDELQIYVSSNDGASARHIPTHSEISSMINTAVNSYSSAVVVADIAARNALVPSVVTIALALDATADLTVASGAATYVYNPVTTSWTKIAEYESLDVTLQWANIQGRPNSTAAQIDQAVADSHTHANKPVLDLLTADANDELMYKGAHVAARLETSAW